MHTLHLVRPPTSPPTGDRSLHAETHDACAHTGDADLLALRTAVLDGSMRGPIVVLGAIPATAYLDALRVPWTHRVLPPAGVVWAIKRTLYAIAHREGCDTVCIHGHALRDLWHRLPRRLRLRGVSMPECSLDPSDVADLPDSSTASRLSEVGSGVRTLMSIDQPASIVDARRLTFLCGLMTVAGVPTRAVVHASAARLATAFRFARFSNIPAPLVLPDPPAALLHRVDLLVSDLALQFNPNAEHSPKAAAALAALSPTPTCLGHLLDWSGVEPRSPTARLPRLAGSLLDTIASAGLAEPAVP